MEPAVARAPASPSPSRDSLRRLLAVRERLPARSPAPPSTGPLDRRLPGEEIAPGLWRRQALLPQPIPAAPLPLAFARRPGEHADPRQLLFFDTETTGLAGGTGTRAFMIGAADWHVDASGSEGLRVRQLTIATLAAEPAMLREFAGWLSPATLLASYNGRSYDAPLLKARFRLARLAEPLSALDHLDLLHPARRHWRGRWENCRLATIERHALGIVREDDLPGSQAPAAWLDYLRGGDAGNVHRVAAHNHQDVVTLARLFLRLVEAQAVVSESG
ncbi:MAG: ribonuclease H-like domain-containing protein [Pseudoxanthomonas sp.]